MSKIAILCAGGTISMIPGAAGLEPDAHFPQRLSAFLAAQGVEDCEVLEHAAIDSSSARPQDWLGLARRIQDLAKDFEAFIVLHGTDTMAYSAAALYQCLSASGKRIMLTGSQLPLAAADNDAAANLLGAIAFARLNWQSVAVYFGGRLLHGNGTRKVDAQDFAAFASPNEALWGTFKDGVAQLHAEWIEAAPACLDLDLKPRPVAMLYVTPAMAASAYACLADETLAAVIVQSYGVGNLPEDEGLQSALAAAHRRGLRLYNVSQCLRARVEQDTYAVGAGRLGLRSGGKATPESLYVACVLGCEHRI